MMHEDYRLFFLRDCALGTGAMFVLALTIEWFGQSRMGVFLSIIGVGLMIQVLCGVFAMSVWQERRRHDG